MSYRASLRAPATPREQGQEDQPYLGKGWHRHEALASGCTIDLPTGTPYQVSEAGSALRVAVGRGRQHRPVERACAK